jgi:formate hydrogenlyase subunit 6/NADH:ubiquinone oxidoreductase subunit I
MCPVVPRAVDWTDGDRSRPPAHDYSKCIRCYCCQEVCPEKAITVKKPLLRRMLIRKH